VGVGFVRAFGIAGRALVISWSRSMIFATDVKILNWLVGDKVGVFEGVSVRGDVTPLVIWGWLGVVLHQ
jgi:hypothetical protein